MACKKIFFWGIDRFLPETCRNAKKNFFSKLKYLFGLKKKFEFLLCALMVSEVGTGSHKGDVL